MEDPIANLFAWLIVSITVECKPTCRLGTLRWRKIFPALAVVVLFARWPALDCTAQTSSRPSHKQLTHAASTDDPEERVDVIAPETYLIPMTHPSPIAVLSVRKIDGGAIFTMQPGTMKVSLCSDNIVHVSYGPGNEAPIDNSLAVIGCQKPSELPMDVVEGPNDIRLQTDKLSIRVIRSTGALSFFTSSGTEILSEPADGGKVMLTAMVNHQDTHHIQQEFVSQPDEALYGMAEAQDGIWNWRGIPIDLISQNMIGAFPVMVSSRGYGFLWDNESLTEFNPVNPDEQIALDPQTNSGVFTARKSDDYVFFVKGGDGTREIGISVGDIVHDNRNMWVPYTSVVKVHLTAGQIYPVRVLGGGKAAKLYGRPLGNTTVFRSEVGDQISYYFVYGPSLDKVLAGYRVLTGTAPLFPKWAYGFWQCREHYSSQKQTLEAAQEFRNRHIPVDLIIQDWQYWGKWGWGAYQFDPTTYPDPAQMIKKLHQLNFHYMISVWQDPKGEVYDDLQKHHGIIPGRTGGTPDDTGFVNELYSKARAIRWKYLKRYMFDIGVDGWWQDGEELNEQLRNHTVYVDNLGDVSGNPYAYYSTQAANQGIYQGQRAADPTKRVVQLGKTATLGFQRYAAATWSGDVHGSWQALSQQIPAGLNLSIGGIPYWATDTGGFFRPADQYTSADYNRLLVRWFEYSTFCPILRIHGFKTATEMWKWPLSYKYLLAYDKFRYRLLPYTYSQAWRVTHDNDTFMRPLVMDFPHDRDVGGIGDQYMFGPAFMVAPITTPDNKRSIYLPNGCKWTNFWTGDSFTGNRKLNVESSIDQIPLFIRAGTILPLGPVMEYATEKPEDPIELRIYSGANGSFTLYEDENDNYNYEKGQYATIEFSWNDVSRTLTIGPRTGSFPGMQTERKFTVVVVRPGHGTGMDVTVHSDQVVSYNGNLQTIHLGAPAD